MEIRDTEAELLREATAAFHRATGIRIRRLQLIPQGGGLRADARLLFEFPHAQKSLDVEVKRVLNTQTVGHAIERMERRPKALLVTRYVNPNMAERLKQMQIPFLDTLGNAYLNFPPAFVYVRGQEPRKFPRERVTRAFGAAGLKVVFALLTRQELAGAAFRTIAHTTHVALGTVAWVLGDLEGLGHLLVIGKRGRRLIRKQQLVERWAAAFPNQLRPKLLLGRYTPADLEWWKKAQVGDFHAYWGGEPAAARLTGHLKPELLTIYIRDMPGRFLAANRLRTDPKGNIEILKAFWATECDGTNREITHPLLVYADLLRTADPRNIEAARRIYDENLAGVVRED